MLKILLAFLIIFVALGVRAGTNSLSSVSSGKVQTTHVNQYYSAMNQDVVPRNSSGVPTTRAGSLGSSTYKWLKSWIESGYWKAGDIKMHHTYNGTVYCGQGWMRMDGRVINEANYDSENGHAAGDWDIYVVTSPLDGKYLPNMASRYAVGSDQTTQTGASAITAVGNSGNTANVQHTHTVAAHNHRWYLTVPTGHDRSYDSGGSSLEIIAGTSGGTSENFDHFVINNSNANAGPSVDFYTANTSLTTANGGSTTQSIQPDSIEVQYCMRVIE